jgi:hypothetical protein
MNHRLYTLVLCTLISGATHAQNPAAPAPAQILPDFSFKTPDNSVFTPIDLPREKKLFFVFFDPTCEHCQRAISHIDREYKSFLSASIYLISMEDWAKINWFMKKYAPHLGQQKNVTLLQDKPGLFISRFKPLKFPSMFLYSADKKLIDYEDDETTVSRFVNAIRDK